MHVKSGCSLLSVNHKSSLGSWDKTELLFIDQRWKNIPGCSRPHERHFLLPYGPCCLPIYPQPGIDNHTILFPWHDIRTQLSPDFEGLEGSHLIEKRSSQKLSVLRGERKPQPQNSPHEQRHLCDFPHLKHSGPSSLAEELKDILSLLLRRSLRQTHEPFQSEGWGGVLIKVIILSWTDYLERHLNPLEGFKDSNTDRAQETYCLCRPLDWGCQHCWCPAWETWGCIEESGDALPVAKPRMSILERTWLSQVRGGSFRASATFSCQKRTKTFNCRNVRIVICGEWLVSLSGQLAFCVWNWVIWVRFFPP